VPFPLSISLPTPRAFFRGERVTPGLYTVRVTLAGFLPTLEQHVRINPHVTTVVRVELESMFASLDQLRRTLPLRQWNRTTGNGFYARLRPRVLCCSGSILTTTGRRTVASTNLDNQVLRPRARLEFTDGARRPGSASGVPSAPATAFAYDQRLGRSGRLIMAGQINYLDSSPGGGVATIWLPTVRLDPGPIPPSSFAMQNSARTEQIFRGVRMEQGGTLSLGETHQAAVQRRVCLSGIG